MIVLGLVGKIGSGKGHVSDILVKKYGFKVFGMGDFVREETKKRGLELNRDNLQKIVADITKKGGQEFIIKGVVKKIKQSGNERVLIDGIRRMIDYKISKSEFPNFKMIRIDAEPKLRFERMKKRNRPGDPQTMEEFWRQEKNEFDLYKTFQETLTKADYVIDNNCNDKEINKRIDKIMKQLL